MAQSGHEHCGKVLCYFVPDNARLSDGPEQVQKYGFGSVGQFCKRAPSTKSKDPTKVFISIPKRLSHKAERTTLCINIQANMETLKQVPSLD